MEIVWGIVGCLAVVMLLVYAFLRYLDHQTRN